MDREHLDGEVVGLEPARVVLICVAGARLRDPAAQPGRQRGRPEPVGGAGTMQQLGDVSEVGQRALTTCGAQDASRKLLADGDRLGQRRHALGAQESRPAVQAAVDALELGGGGGGQALGVPAAGTA